MINWRGIGAAAASVVILSLLGMIVYRDNLVVSVSLAGLIVVMFAIWGRIHRKQHIKQLSIDLEQPQETFLCTLNHHRHDWMNDLQVLYGYIKLKKYEKLVDYIEKIRERMVRESMITKLGYAPLSFYLLSFRTQANTLHLEVDVDGDVNLSKLLPSPKAIQQLVENTVGSIQKGAKLSYDEPNGLLFKVEAKDKRLNLGFIYNGEYDLEELRSVVERTIIEERNGLPGVEFSTDFQEKKAAIWAMIPLNTY